MTEVLLVSIPSLIVLLTAWLIIRNSAKQQTNLLSLYVGKELERTRAELQHKSKEIALPIRLQAYERMTLFCARIELHQLLSRCFAPNMLATQLKSAMLSSIDEEFSHNITQQMYMSEDLWNLILLAKAEAAGIIKRIGEQLSATDNAQDFYQKLVEYSQTEPQIGYLNAQSGIKKEVNMLF